MPDAAEPTIPSLIESWVSRGDQVAARTLMEHWHPMVAAIIRRHCINADDWADLEQETFVSVFRALPDFRPVQPVEHWISRIALNTCRQRWRSQSRRPEVRWSDLSEGEQQVFNEAKQAGELVGDIAATDARSVMLRLMESLSAEDRLVLTLLHLEEKSVAEIAALTGMNRVLVKVRAFRARKRLQAMLSKLAGESEGK